MRTDVLITVRTAINNGIWVSRGRFNCSIGKDDCLNLAVDGY
jgi:hypothetical protein